MKILSIDTSTKYLSAAITEDARPIASVSEKDELKHSAMLIPTIDKLLKKCHLKLKNISAIALSIGPGSFTGLRIGVATCKGINLALGTPIVAVPTLDAIAYNFINEETELLCPLIDAKKNKIYSSFYGVNGNILHRLSHYMLTDVDSMVKNIDRPTLVFGDAVKLYGDYLRKNTLLKISTTEWHPKAETVAKLGLEKAKKRQFVNPDKLAPMYLHSQYCQVKGHTG